MFPWLTGLTPQANTKMLPIKVEILGPGTNWK